MNKESSSRSWMDNPFNIIITIIAIIAVTVATAGISYLYVKAEVERLPELETIEVTGFFQGFYGNEIDPIIIDNVEYVVEIENEWEQEYLMHLVGHNVTFILEEMHEKHEYDYRYIGAYINTGGKQ